MASVPPTMVQSLTPAPGSGESAAANSDGATGLSQENQSDVSVFSKLMKQAVPQEKKAAKDVLVADLAVSIQPLQTQPTDATLPPPGMMLPLSLAPGLPEETAVPGHKASGDSVMMATQAQGQGQSAALNVLPHLSGDAKAASKLKLMPAGTPVDDGGGDKHLSNQLIADLSAQHTQLSHVTGATSTNDGQNHAAQMLLKDMSAILASRHSDPAANAKGTVETVATNNGAGAMLQAGDKAPMAAPTPTPTITTPVNHPDWGDEMSSRIHWMVRQDVQTASVKLNPPHLGPLEVKVSVVNDQVNVSFTAQHAPVRDALDASMPRLRELLGHNGLQLGDANVTQHSYSNQQQSGQQGFSGDGGHSGNYGAGQVDDGMTEVLQEPLHYVGNNAIDFYA